MYRSSSLIVYFVLAISLNGYETDAGKTCHMDSIPLEILQEIGKHLDYRSYHNTRISSRRISLPSIQLVTFSSFKTSKVWDLQQLLLDSIHPRNYLEFLELYCQKEHCKLLKYKSLPPELLQTGFRLLGASAGDSFFDMNKARMMYCIYSTGCIPPDFANQMPLKTFCQAGFMEAVQMLLESIHVDPAVEDDFCIRVAAQNGHEEIVQMLLLQERVNPGNKVNDAICSAAYYGHTKIVELLLKHPMVDPAARNNFPIQYAARHQHIPIVKLLMQDPRVDPSANDNFAFKQVFNFENFDVARLLLQDPRVDPSVDDDACLRFYTLHGEYEIVASLLEDPRVNPLSRNGEIIQLALRKGHDSIVQLLQAHSVSR
jgi:hypothetical protein